ncbi:hypothetical protein F5X98DRAFT_379062 [Xylaria grammica]|nr:hypothetical protein F5X98DRAFT_379062 [Xylaria grammica]
MALRHIPPARIEGHIFPRRNRVNPSRPMIKPDEYEFIHNTMSISGLIDTISKLPTDPPSLYLSVDLVGTTGSERSVILAIYVYPTRYTYLMDVDKLAHPAFTTPGTATPLTLMSIFKNAAIPKVFFDLGYSSYVLRRNWNVTLKGAYDLQLVEIPKPLYSHSDPAELRMSFEREKPMTITQRNQWIKSQEKAIKHIKQCRYHTRLVFKGILTSEVKEHCVENAKLIRDLWSIFDRWFESEWQGRVREATTTRLLVVRVTSDSPPS